MSAPEELSPLVEVERRVQERAKDLALDLETAEGARGLRALLNEQIVQWNDDHKRGLRPYALADTAHLAERAYRNLAGYGPLTELLDDDDVWEVIIKEFPTSTS